MVKLLISSLQHMVGILCPHSVAYTSDNKNKKFCDNILIVLFLMRSGWLKGQKHQLTNKAWGRSLVGSGVVFIGCKI